MVKEVHEMTETLIKIKAGTFSSEELDALHFDAHVFMDAQHNGGHGYDDYNDYSDELYDDYYGEQEDMDDYDYGIGNHRGIQKQLNKKAGQRKVTNK